MKESYIIYRLDNTHAGDAGRESRHTNLEKVCLREGVPDFQYWVQASAWLHAKVSSGILSADEQYTILHVITFE